MSSTRWRTRGALAFAVTVMAASGGYAVWVSSRPPVQRAPASVSSTAGAIPSGRYISAVEESRRLARALVVRDYLPGFSVAVSAKDEVVWSEGFGLVDANNVTPVTPQTRFRLGALSRPLTAVAAARLRDLGHLDLDVPIQHYVPAYPKKQWVVTTRHLLGDVAGVHRIRGDNNDAMPVSHCENVGQAVTMLADDPLLFEPGTQHRYAIWGWVLVSAVVEGASREPFARAMDRHVFAPLGMKDTIAAETEGIEGVAHQGRRPDYSCLAGSGALLSTPTDLVRLGSAMLMPGLLTAETIATFTTPTRLESGAPTTYALGWTVTSIQIAGTSTRLISHRGSPMGGSASLLAFPDLGLAVAVAANVTDATGIGPFATQVAELFAKKP